MDTSAAVPPSPARVETASTHKESNERDCRLPDGSHQSPFSFGGVMAPGGREGAAEGLSGRGGNRLLISIS